MEITEISFRKKGKERDLVRALMKEGFKLMDHRLNTEWFGDRYGIVDPELHKEESWKVHCPGHGAYIGHIKREIITIDPRRSEALEKFLSEYTPK